MKVSIIKSDNIYDLEKYVNEHIRLWGSEKVKDIKYSSSMAGTSHNVYKEYSAMIIVK